jgi:hypothetical protein
MNKRHIALIFGTDSKQIGNLTPTLVIVFIHCVDAAHLPVSGLLIKVSTSLAMFFQS